MLYESAIMISKQLTVSEWCLETELANKRDMGEKCRRKIRLLPSLGRLDIVLQFTNDD